MALIKTRPDVRLLLPHPLAVGRVAEFIVELDCPKPVPVSAISLTLLAEVVWFTTSQHGRHRHGSRFLNHHVPLLADETTLEVGKHRLRTRVGLDERLPGSWEGDRLAIEYTVKVHVDIPWWPDKRVEFVVRVGDLAGPELDEGAMVFVSHAGGPPAKGPYLELSLGQRSVRPGGKLRLSAALGNTDRNRYRKLHVELIAQESFPTGLGGSYAHEHTVARWGVGLDAHPGELQPIPFGLDLPRTLGKAFSLHGCQLRWLLQANADVAWGVDPKLRLPIQVQPRELDEDVEVAAPLAVGSDRLRLIWSKVAQDTGVELVDDRLRGVAGRVSIDVHRSHLDGRARVLGLLEFPALGVGLRPHRERRSLLGGLESGLATRDEGQSAVVAEQLGAALDTLGAELIEAEDDRILVGLDGAGLEFAPLAAFVRGLVELAARVDSLPEHLPMPALMRAHEDAWTRAARALSAQLCPGLPAIEIVREGLVVTIACEYDDEDQLRATRLTLDPKLAIPTRHHLVWTSDTTPPEHALGLAELVTPPSWTESSRVILHVVAEQVGVVLAAPLPNPTLERARIEGLFALGRELHGEQGPYR